MPMNLDGYTTLKPISEPEDKLATFYGTIVDGSGYRSLAIYQQVDAMTGSGATMTGAVGYGSFSVLDAYEYDTAGDTWVTLRYDTTDQIQLAHKFTTVSGSTPTFYSVTFTMKQVGTVAAAKYLWATIEADSSGPDGTAIWSSYKILANSLTKASAGEEITFYFRGGTTQALSASTVYYSVLSGDWSVSTSNHLAIHVDTVASGGTLWVYDAAWANTTTQSPYTQSKVVASWTAVAAYAFTAATAVIEDVEGTAIQEQIVDLKVYGPAIQYSCVESGTTSTCLMSVMGILGDPKYPA